MSKLDRINLIRSDIVKNLTLRSIKFEGDTLSTKAAECIVDYLIDCIADLEIKLEALEVSISTLRSSSEE